MADPVELAVGRALLRAGIPFTFEGEPGPATDAGLDFHLTDMDVFIEVKRFHSPRIAKQMARRENVIAIQGMGAALAFEQMISAQPDTRKE